MTNKIANFIAVRVTRPLITGQRNDATEAAVDGIIHAVMGEELLPPCNPEKMYHAPKKP